MSFTTFRFALLCGIFLVIYYRIPGKWQWMVLLGASWCFYLAAGAQYAGFLLVTTFSTYAAARMMANNQAALEKKRAKTENKPILLGALLLNATMLFLCKGLLLTGNVLSVLPLGISFYMFQSMGYAIDVYRGTAKAEGNLLKFSLFVSWFPQLIQGPISRFQQLSPQLSAPHPYDRKAVSFGFQRMLWGAFKKLVVADRIAVAVAALKGPEYTGMAFLVLTVFYAVQIYADFTGGIDMALGVSQMFGITLKENFIRPFFAKNTAEYWRRWHISLGEWMKDYIFYPVSISAPMRRLSKAARGKWGKFGRRLPVYVASLATWAVTGIWHGLTPNFLLWGLLNCLVIVISEELSPLYGKFHARFPITDRSWYDGFQMVRMFFLMNLIRACDLFPQVGEYFRRIGSVFTAGRMAFLWDGGLLELGLSGLDYGILFLGIVLIFSVSLFQEKLGSVREWLWPRPNLRAWLLFGLFLATLLLGRYGVGYDEASFIYNQF